MGAADSVPGVSGGTMALIVGIYERLLGSIGTGARALVSLLKLDWPGFRRRLSAVDWGLLVPLLSGIALAIIVAARIIPGLLDRFPEQSRALFLGMVTASLIIPWRRVSEHTPVTVGLIVLAAVPAFLLSGLPSGTIESPALWQVLTGAMVAICAMILPGVSGSFLLLVLGLYEPTLEAVRDLDLIYLAVFASGAVVGLGTFAVVLTRLLAQFHDRTMAVLLGLMIGSLRALWPWQTSDRDLLLPDGDAPLWSVVAVGVIGLVAVWALDRWAFRRSASLHGHADVTDSSH
jgi:putative membrane protein